MCVPLPPAHLFSSSAAENLLKHIWLPCLTVLPWARWPISRGLWSPEGSAWLRHLSLCVCLWNTPRSLSPLGALPLLTLTWILLLTPCHQLSGMEAVPQAFSYQPISDLPTGCPFSTIFIGCLGSYSQHVGSSSLTGGGTHVPCIARCIVSHWIAREVP